MKRGTIILAGDLVKGTPTYGYTVEAWRIEYWTIELYTR